MIFKTQVEGDKNKHDIFGGVLNRVVNDASGYLRNEQLNLPFSVICWYCSMFFFIHDVYAD